MLAFCPLSVLGIDKAFLVWNLMGLAVLVSVLILCLRSLEEAAEYKGLRDRCLLSVNLVYVLATLASYPFLTNERGGKQKR